MRKGKLANIHRYLDRETVYVMGQIIEPVIFGGDNYTMGDLGVAYQLSRL